MTTESTTQRALLDSQGSICNKSGVDGHAAVANTTSLLHYQLLLSHPTTEQYNTARECHPCQADSKKPTSGILEASAALLRF